MACFRRSVLCEDITKALHNLLARCREDLAPDHESPFQRYHIVHMMGKRPTLGSTMQFEKCDREHGVGYCHPDLMCFDPSESAIRYMDKFLSTAKNFRWTDSRHCDEVDRLFTMYKDCIPSRYLVGWSNAVRNIFLALHKGIKWDPTIHGVLFWTCIGDFKDFAQEFFHEITVIGARRNVRDSRLGAGRREWSE
jgi:hypothetical protein